MVGVVSNGDEKAGGQLSLGPAWAGMLLLTSVLLAVMASPSAAQNERVGIRPEILFPGQLVEIQGAGFPPGVEVLVQPVNTTGCFEEPILEGVADADGQIDFELMLPLDLEPGTHSIEICRRFGEFFDDVANLQVTVESPTVRILNSLGEQRSFELPRVEPVRLTPSVQHGDESLLSFLWIVQGPDTEISQSLEVRDFELEMASAEALGTYVAAVVMFENGRTVATDAIEFVVVNRPPTLELACPGPATVGDEVQIALTAEDLDGPDPLISWAIDEGATQVSPEGGVQTIEVPSDVVATSRVDVVATDSDGATGRADCVVTIDAPVETEDVTVDDPEDVVHKGIEDVAAGGDGQAPEETEVVDQASDDDEEFVEVVDDTDVPVDDLAEDDVPVGDEPAQDSESDEIFGDDTIEVPPLPPEPDGSFPLWAWLVPLAAIGTWYARRRQSSGPRHELDSTTTAPRPPVVRARLGEGDVEFGWPDGPEHSWRCFIDHDSAASTINELKMEGVMFGEDRK